MKTAIILFGQIGCVLTLSIFTLCYFITTFYRLPYPYRHKYTVYGKDEKWFIVENFSSKNKNQSLRMSERSELIKRARASERMSLVFIFEAVKKVKFILTYVRYVV
jgi:hypothetical protein